MIAVEQEKSMSSHKGKPSGINKPETRGTGVPSDFKPEKLEADNTLTEKYTEDDADLAKGLKVKHHNRNTNKKHSRV
jgi:hypothetical protein